MFCTRCKQNPAIVFVSKIDGPDSAQKGEPIGYCLKCAMELNIGPVKQLMDKMGIGADEIDEISEQFNALMGVNDDPDFEVGGSPSMPNLSNLFSALGSNESDSGNYFGGFGIPQKDTEIDSEDEEDGKKKRRRRKDSKGDKKKRRYLSTYCTDLTERAREGKLDNIIGRDQEIARAIQILCRRSKNNPCLIGEPGVGKTAIAEGLAIRIAAGEVPAKLKDKEIHLLDLTALVAGTQFRGQFESRIKGLVEEVKKEGNIILFIDEVHNLVGTGDAEGTMNAANILKPSLSRGEIQVIGATTFTEYRKHIEKDAALERRFQPIKIEEPSIEQTFEVLKGIKGYYEDYHRVKISDDLVHRAVVLSERYITDRFLPDKAIDLLDEACTCANLRNKAISEAEIAEKELEDARLDLADMEADTENPDYEEQAKVKAEIIAIEADLPKLLEKAKDNDVLEEDLAKVIQLWTGIPASKVIESDLRKLANLESELKKHIKGQPEAVAAVSSAVKRSRVQINARRRPASFIFVGPTGVGKTELVKQLSMQLFDTPETLIRLDMSEFMEKHSVSRIIGSPPGYVGYDEAGQLTEKVRRKPYSVILFDEIEKAHPDVMNILLQILDEGKINDAQGRTVNFENTVIIMTSNAGSERKEGALGFGKTEDDANEEKSMKALRDFLRPEFLGRVDEIVFFKDLTKEDYEEIAILMLSELEEPIKEKGMKFSYDKDVPKAIVEKMDSNVRGARDLRNVIRRNIENKVADIIIDAEGTAISQIKVSVSDGELVVKSL
ncbi:MAG: ATP-dependent Clp protease ATP-binding subunit [Ruminococcaceae bacterium]|nr:ATP-dependent Clp protease ATP-binding subunit [Oscillospiraceae bacterium]